MAEQARLDPLARAELVLALARARSERRQLRELPPEWSALGEAEACEVMFDVAQALSWPVDGWKIAATNPEMQARLRTDSPVFGVTYAAFRRPAPCTLPTAGLLSPVVECEFFFRLGRDLPGRGRPYTEAEIEAAIDSVRLGVEVAECRFHERHLPGKALLIADGFASGWYVEGPRIDAWRPALARGVEVLLWRNGEIKGRGSSHDVMGHPLRPVVWLANRLNAMGRALRAGDTVSSGSCNIMARARAGDRFRAEYGGLGVIELGFD